MAGFQLFTEDQTGNDRNDGNYSYGVELHYCVLQIDGGQTLPIYGV